MVKKLFRKHTINPLKTDSVKCLGPVDVSEILTAVENIPACDWETQNKDKPNKFDVLNSTQHIVFKFVDDLMDHSKYHERAVWASWEQLVQPILDSVAGQYPYKHPQFPRVMLAKLPAGASINRHIDRWPAARFPHKIHVPLFTNDRTYFCHDKSRYHFPVGEAFEVNNNIHHWAENNGTTERIHLIFECFG